MTTSPPSQQRKSWKDSFRFKSIMRSQESTSSSSSVASLRTSELRYFAKSDKLSQNFKIVTALYKYKTKDKNELGFNKDEKLAILDDYAPGWWIACKIASPNKTGCIPINYVTVDLHNKEWYFSNISRFDAETFLMNSLVDQGCYLIRKSDLEPDDYILSIRNTDSVRHYTIQSKQNGDYFINSERTFAKLDDLVAHYSSIDSNDISFQRLTKPCPVKAPNVSEYANRLDDDEIKVKRLEIVRELVWLSNDYIKVHFGLFKKNGMKKSIIIKALEQGLMSVSAFFHEANIMRQLNHKNILKLVGISNSKRPLIITEYLDKGDLLTYLRDSSEADKLNVNQLLQMAAHIASAMCYLEQKKIVHRNLMARNCMVGEDNVVKLANFTHARELENEVYLTKNREMFPIKWTAPEAYNQGIFSTKSEIWSFGVVLMEVITKGMVPYCGISVQEVMQKVEQGYRMPKPVNIFCPESIYQMMLECWSAEPEKRARFAYLYSYIDMFPLIDAQNKAENHYELL